MNLGTTAKYNVPFRYHLGNYVHHPWKCTQLSLREQHTEQETLLPEALWKHTLLLSPALSSHAWRATVYPLLVGRAQLPGEALMVPTEQSGFRPSGLSRVLGSQSQRKAVPRSRVPSFCSSQTKCFSLKNLAFISLFYVKEEHIDRDELSKNSETVLLRLSEYIRLKKI